jgi:hypothetical protein
MFKILLPTVALLGPLALAMRGRRLSKQHVEDKVEADEANCRTPWSLVINSAVMYALAYNITYFMQELFLVIPKAIYGLQPILYHNNHRWLRSDPIQDLLQGTGALTILILGLVFAGILIRQKTISRPLRLFLIWMTYHGLVQSLQQLPFVVVNPNSDVADALNYLGASEALRYVLATAALVSLVLLGLAFTRPLLELAPSPIHVASPRSRRRFMSQITLSAFIGVVLTVPFKIPPLGQIEGPIIVFLLPMLWTLANSWRVTDATPLGPAENEKVNLIPALTLLGLLAIFRLYLAPGVPFFYTA